MKTKNVNNAILRAVWGFVMFIPFCWFWGVESGTWFSFFGTLYFIPVHWLFDKINSIDCGESATYRKRHWKDDIAKEYFDDKR